MLSRSSTKVRDFMPLPNFLKLHLVMGSSQTFKYRVMIPLSPILIPEIVSASKPHLLKLAFPGSCIARIIGQRGQVISHIKDTFKCTIFSANQGVYVFGLQSSQARLFKIGSQGHGLEQLGARSGVQVNLLPGHLLHCRGSQDLKVC